MAEISHTEKLDHITQAIGPYIFKKDKGKLLSKPREEVLGLKYKEGEVVIDGRTGNKATVIGTARANIEIQGP